MSVFAGDGIQPLKELWVIGDAYINEYFHELQKLQDQKKEKKQSLFIFKQYRVRCFTARPLSEITNVAVRLVNAFIKALNENQKLPKKVVFIPEWDLIKYIDYYEKDAKQVFFNVLSWMFTKIDRAIQARKDSIAHRCPAAILPHQPMFMWVKMISRHPEYDRALKHCTKFNAVIEDLVQDRKEHFHLDINYAMNKQGYFVDHNRLTEEGVFAYWKEFDKCMEIEYKKELEFTELLLKVLKNLFINKTKEENETQA